MYVRFFASLMLCLKLGVGQFLDQLKISCVASFYVCFACAFGCLLQVH